ncbi:sensor histidine kinase [Pseudobdellovibrio exovorus]|uniref:sensor histidine kinase n=1 Tax=Pseudobdellovibrio exovorus TaxID=453816 RepID=UPI00034ACA41|nr:HAMP domain-containing sensor histidine kinase [Pseudobdellovibrio exovorus]
MVTFLKKPNLKVRLTALFVLIFGATTLTFALFMYYALNDSLLNEFDNSLYNYAIDVTRSLEAPPANEPAFTLFPLDEDKIFPFSTGKSLISIRHSSGEIIVQTEGLEQWPLPYKEAFLYIQQGHDSHYLTLHDTSHLSAAESASYRLITFPLDIGVPPDYYLQIAVPMTTFETQLERLKSIILYGFPLLILISVVAGFYVSSKAMTPINQLIDNMNHVQFGRLSDRVALPESHDEIRTLTETHNRMLDRIEDAFRSQERFIANASHQLLTPLTVLKGEIETHLNQNKEQDQFLQSLIEETDKLTKIVHHMLLLSRIESGLEHLHFQDIEVDTILFQVIADLQKKASTRNIKIDVKIHDLADRQALKGQEDLVYNLIYNILENAIKYSPQDKSVSVTLTWNQDATTLDIVDYGSGIDSENIPLIFDRFMKINSMVKTSGYGLGLSIAKKIADLHGFRIAVLEPAMQGAHFQVTMPYTADASH